MRVTVAKRLRTNDKSSTFRRSWIDHGRLNSGLTNNRGAGLPFPLWRRESGLSAQSPQNGINRRAVAHRQSCFLVARGRECPHCRGAPTPLHCHHGVDVGLSFRSDDRNPWRIDEGFRALRGVTPSARTLCFREAPIPAMPAGSADVSGSLHQAGRSRRKPTLVGLKENQRINPMQSKLPRQRVFLQAATVTGQETHLGELYNANLPAAPFPAVVRFAPIASEPSHRSESTRW
jgi:hypothetical protein